jgi:hypothetical protein
VAPTKGVATHTRHPGKISGQLKSGDDSHRQTLTQPTLVVANPTFGSILSLEALIHPMIVLPCKNASGS